MSSSWHNPTPRDRYAMFRRVLIAVTILLTLAILIELAILITLV